MKVISSIILIITIFFTSIDIKAQTNQNINAAARMMSSDKKLTIGGYGQIDFNQPINNDNISNGKLDVHRMVLLFGYRFNDRLSFVTEVEFEHVKEVYVEQAFLDYSLNNYVNIRGGLMLVPMGIINEYHEPTTFNGVERPLIDKYISPTTWREIGIGITGIIPELSMKYQAYVMNGFSSYTDGARLSGKYGMRKGRQKGAESFIRRPVFAGRIDYFGILGLNLGFSTYIGKTQSSLFSNLDKSDNPLLLSADSSVVGMNMFGFDAKYNKNGLSFRGQVYYTMLSNTIQYNNFTSSDGDLNDLGESMYGYYIEAGYDVFHQVEKIKSQLITFVRYSAYDTQNTVADGIIKDQDYNVQVITAGIGWKPVPGVAVKADIQFTKPESSSTYNKVFDAGIAVWF